MYIKYLFISLFLRFALMKDALSEDSIKLSSRYNETAILSKPKLLKGLKVLTFYNVNLLSAI